MASEKNITMRQYNGVDYDTLYPKTIAEQVDGVYSKDESLTTATTALYGLPNTAVPDDVLALIKTLIDDNYSELSSLANSKAKIATGSYTGTGSTSKSINIGSTPKIFVCGRSSSGNPVSGRSWFMWVNGAVYGFGPDSYNFCKIPINISGSTISWSNNNASDALNESGQMYVWVAVCI